MEYRILGRLEADSAGRRVALGGWQQRALLAILLLERGRAVSVDRLIDELWGEQPPKAAEHTVRVYVSQLRKLLGEDAVETRERGYALRVEPGALDADRFQKLVIDGHQQAVAGNRAAASQTLLEAFELWRGPPLADFAETAFARAEIARLEELRLGALEDRFELALANGEAASLVSQLEELCLAYPLRERFCAQLMMALYRAGRQADALAAYRRACRSLAELGIDPSERLNRLHTQMLRHDSGLDPSELSGAAQQPPTPTATHRRPRRSLVVLVGVLIATVAIAAVLRTTTATTTPSKPAGFSEGVVSTGNVETVRSCARGDLTVEIDIRSPSLVLQTPGSRDFHTRGRPRPVATIVVRNTSTQRCYLYSGEFDLTIRDRTAKTVMGRWDGPWFAGTYPPGSGKPFSLPTVYTCNRQGPFIAEATVTVDATVNPITTRRDDLTRSEITC